MSFIFCASAVSGNGPWKEVVSETLEDSRQQKDPLPLQEFPFPSQIGRYVKLEVVSYYGHGGGLQQFNIIETKPNLVEFQVKTDSDACILLAPCDECDGYEIVIGGWNNRQSVIRDKKGKPHPGHAVTQVGCMQLLFHIDTSYYLHRHLVF